MRPSGAHGSYSKPHGELSPEALAAAGAEGGTLEELDSLRSGAAKLGRRDSHRLQSRFLEIRGELGAGGHHSGAAPW